MTKSVKLVTLECPNMTTGRAPKGSDSGSSSSSSSSAVWDTTGLVWRVRLVCSVDDVLDGLDGWRSARARVTGGTEIRYGGEAVGSDVWGIWMTQLLGWEMGLNVTFVISCAGPMLCLFLRCVESCAFSRLWEQSVCVSIQFICQSAALHHDGMPA